MKKSLFALFITSLLLTGCTTKGGNNPSGGGGSQPSGTPTIVSADFTTGSPTGDSSAAGFDTKFLSYFGGSTSTYFTSATFAGFSQINVNQRVPADGETKQNIYRFNLGSKSQNGVLDLVFAKPVSQFKFNIECAWSGYYEDGTGPYKRTIVENKVVLYAGTESITLRDVDNGNEGGFELEEHTVNFTNPVSSLNLSGLGRVSFASMTFTFLV